MVRSLQESPHLDSDGCAVAPLKLFEVLACSAAALSRLHRDGGPAHLQELPPHWQHAPVALDGQHRPAVHAAISAHGCCTQVQLSSLSWRQ